MKTIEVSTATPQQLNHLLTRITGKARDYTGDWTHGGALKTQHGVVSGPSIDGRFFAFAPNPTEQCGNAASFGSTELIAAMRCVAKSHLGETVNVPLIRELYEDFVHEETSIRVAELTSPNSHEYEQLHEQLMEDRQWRLQLARELRRRQHTDDMAVDCFARALKAKLAAARAKGRGG